MGCGSSKEASAGPSPGTTVPSEPQQTLNTETQAAAPSHHQTPLSTPAVDDAPTSQKAETEASPAVAPAPVVDGDAADGADAALPAAEDESAVRQVEKEPTLAHGKNNAASSGDLRNGPPKKEKKPDPQLVWDRRRGSMVAASEAAKDDQILSQARRSLAGPGGVEVVRRGSLDVLSVDERRNILAVSTPTRNSTDSLDVNVSALPPGMQEWDQPRGSMVLKAELLARLNSDEPSTPPAPGKPSQLQRRGSRLAQGEIAKVAQEHDEAVKDEAQG